MAIKEDTLKADEVYVRIDPEYGKHIMMPLSAYNKIAKDICAVGSSYGTERNTVTDISPIHKIMVDSGQDIIDDLIQAKLEN